MKGELECYPCSLRFGVEMIKKVGLNKEKIKEILQLYQNSDTDFIPANLSTKMWDCCVKDLKDKDVFKEEKLESNKIVKNITQNFNIKKLNLEDCVKLSILGNLVDYFAPYGISNPEEIARKIDEFLNEELVINDVEKLEKLLNNAKIFYFSDNAGEIGFDKILIEKLLETADKVYLGVKEGPVVNDAMLEDAKFFNLDEICKIVTLPARLGVDFKELSDYKKQIINGCDLLISKGQANYETLTEEKVKNSVTYILRTKCHVIARNLGVEPNSNVCLLEMKSEK